MSAEPVMPLPKRSESVHGSAELLQLPGFRQRGLPRDVKFAHGFGSCFFGTRSEALEGMHDNNLLSVPLRSFGPFSSPSSTDPETGNAQANNPY